MTLQETRDFKRTKVYKAKWQQVVDGTLSYADFTDWFQEVVA
ncbi:hypothetical protein [Streptomyces sp. V1I1]|nr:hypothetical protein [Streptomyces sp. V1I1]MDQ0943147.1 hypothetical protein [Streptomyces sp. V1I1]